MFFTTITIEDGPLTRLLDMDDRLTKYVDYPTKVLLETQTHSVFVQQMTILIAQFRTSAGEIT